MVYQSPTGARDLLPLEVAQKRWIEEHLQRVFHSWGYHRIITSTLERLDTLMAKGAIDSRTVFHIQGVGEELLGLRPELTASIARTVVTRMDGVSFPQRLYYTANVFRRSSASTHNSQQEFYQAGVELLGAGELAADAEVLLLLAESLESLGVCPGETGWQLLLGEASLTESLLREFPPEWQPQVRWGIAHLDRVLLATLPLNLQTQAMFLLDLRGEPRHILTKLSHTPLTPAQAVTLERLESLVDLLEGAWGPKFPLVVDLSLTQDFAYYTGIIFEVIGHTPHGPRVIGQGGRYDQLLGVYHPRGETQPGIGFSLHLEELHQMLSAASQLPQCSPGPEALVAALTPPAQPAAFAVAREHRRTHPQARVVMDLGHEQPVDRERVLAYAREQQIPAVLWVDIQGQVSPEFLD